MKSFRTLPLWLAVAVLSAWLTSTPVQAAGPLALCSPGVPFAYGPGIGSPVPYFTDGGTGGPVLTLADADFLTGIGFTEWSGVGSSSFAAAPGGTLLAKYGIADFDETNSAGIVGVGPGPPTAAVPGFDVIYDDTGLIISTVFGAPPGVLGIAGPNLVAASPTCEIGQSFAVMNLSAVDPGDVTPTVPFPGATFAGVFTHEFGHAINLAHTQTVGSAVFFGDDAYPFGCPDPYGGAAPTFMDMDTMYPFICVSPGCTGIEQATIEHPDDVASISDIYPAGGWPTSDCTIFGTIFDIDGTTPIGGANVVARNVADPFGDAVSALSGDFTQTAADGSYTLNGLTCGATYNVHIEDIIMGGFSQPPTPLPVEEYFNGAGESHIGGAGGDDPCAVTPVVTSLLAHAKASAFPPVMVDIAFNDASLPVELTAFRAVLEGPDAVLTWTTASETGNAGFEVEHAVNGTVFEALGFVEGAGTTAEPQSYSFRAADLLPGIHRFRLKQIDLDGAFEYSPVVEVATSLPDAYVLADAYPNPFNPSTTLSFAVALSQHVQLALYNVQGQQVQVAFDGRVPANTLQTIRLDATGLPSGVYLVRLQGQDFLGTQQIVLAK